MSSRAPAIARAAAGGKAVKLRELEAFFSRYREEQVPPDVFVDGVKHTSGIRRLFLPVATLAEADGIWFLCPKCVAGDGHMVRVGFAGKAVPGTYGHSKDGQPVLWNIAGGSGLDDLSLTPSIQLEGGCNWHGFVGSSGVPPGEAR